MTSCYFLINENRLSDDAIPCTYGVLSELALSSTRHFENVQSDAKTCKRVLQQQPRINARTRGCEPFWLPATQKPDVLNLKRFDDRMPLLLSNFCRTSLWAASPGPFPPCQALLPVHFPHRDPECVTVQTWHIMVIAVDEMAPIAANLSWMYQSRHVDRLWCPKVSNACLSDQILW